MRRNGLSLLKACSYIFLPNMCLRKSRYLEFHRARPQCLVLHTLLLTCSWYQTKTSSTTLPSHYCHSVKFPKIVKLGSIRLAKFGHTHMSVFHANGPVWQNSTMWQRNNTWLTSLEPRPSSPPDLRPSGRGPGKTSILFGEIRASASIFCVLEKVSLFRSWSTGTCYPALILKILFVQSLWFVAFSVRLSCYTKKRLRLCQVEKDDQTNILQGKSRSSAIAGCCCHNDKQSTPSAWHTELTHCLARIYVRPGNGSISHSGSRPDNGSKISKFGIFALLASSCWWYSKVDLLYILGSMFVTLLDENCMFATHNSLMICMNCWLSFERRERSRFSEVCIGPD